MRQNVVLFISKLDLLVDLSVKALEVGFSESIVLEEASDLVIDVLADLRLVSILEFEFVDEHALELLSLLDIHQLFLASFSHAPSSRPWSFRSHS